MSRSKKGNFIKDLGKKEYLLISLLIAMTCFVASTTYHIWRLQNKTYYNYSLSTATAIVVLEMEGKGSHGPY